jgi:hypothetical protein
MLVKLADLHWRQGRDRPPHLIGKVADFWLPITGRSNPIPGQPDFTLFIGRWPATLDAKPLQPVWDAVSERWVGPAEPDHPGGFYDDIADAVADFEE